VNSITPTFSVKATAPCRCCGASEALQSASKTYGVCEHCWGLYKSWEKKWASDQPKTVYLFNRWLARQAYLQAKRLKRFGVTGRCEAVTAHANNYRSAGCQCARHAVNVREDRRVCENHFKANPLRFIDATDNDPYLVLASTLKDIALVDVEMRTALETVFGFQIELP